MRRTLAAVPLVALLGGCALAPAAAAPSRPPLAANPPAAVQAAGGGNLQAGFSNVGQSPLEVFPDGFDGKGAPLPNGGAVALGEGVSAAVFLDPYPASGSSAWLDLYVTKEGQPLGDAAVATETQMAYMTHGGLRLAGRNSGGGHYLFALKYSMAGIWRQRIIILAAGESYELPLVVTVYP